MSAMGYWRELVERFGHGWNRFWFLPVQAHTVSALRILVGAVAFYLVAAFSPDLELFFGDGGLLPVEDVQAIREGAQRGVRWSYLDYLHSPSELWAGHLAGMAVLACFTVGLASRVSSVLSLVVFLSYFHRGPMLTSEVDLVVAFMLLYLCVGPTGAHWSLDRWLARRNRKAGEPPPHRASYSANICTRLIQVHLCLAYSMMALGKLSYSDVWWDGTATWWLMARPESALVDLGWLGGASYLLNAWTHAIVLFELSFAVLIWAPLARPLLLVAGGISWTLLALLTGMVPFCLMMVIASLAFVSPAATQRFMSRSARRAA